MHFHLITKCFRFCFTHNVLSVDSPTFSPPIFHVLIIFRYQVYILPDGKQWAEAACRCTATENGSIYQPTDFDLYYTLDRYCNFLIWCIKKYYNQPIVEMIFMRAERILYSMSPFPPIKACRMALRPRNAHVALPIFKVYMANNMTDTCSVEHSDITW